MQSDQLFAVEKLNGSVVVSPTADLGEFNMSDDQSSLFDHLVRITDGYNVVVDLSQTDYFGSSAIGLFNRLVSHVTDKSHRIAFCNLSEHETEVIDITHLNQIWEIKGSRNDALQFVSEPVAS